MNKLLNIAFILAISALVMVLMYFDWAQPDNIIMIALANVLGVVSFVIVMVYLVWGMV